MAYTFQTITVPGAVITQVNGINNADEVSGSYALNILASGAPSVFTEADGSFSFAPPGTFALARDQAGGINNLGQVATTEGGGTTTPEGIVWSAAGPTTLISESGFFIHAFDVNDAGTVVGWLAPLSGGTVTGLVYQDGSITQLQVQGASATQAHGINNSGVIVGTADSYGFIDFGGNIALMGIAGATAMDPMAINNDDAVVGSYYDGANWHGFIDAGGRLTFINAPGATDTWVTGINDAGDISGYFDTGDVLQTTGFIATYTSPDPIATMVREDYVAALGRDADAGGLSFWVQQLNSGLTAASFVADLTGSAEFQSLHGQQTDGQYVDILYVNALGRHAEPAGQAGWVSVLQAGASRGDVMAAIAQSPEGQRHFAMTHG